MIDNPIPGIDVSGANYLDLVEPMRPEDIHVEAGIIRDEISSGAIREHLAMRVNALSAICHGNAYAGGWWSDIHSGEPLIRNDGELIALMHSELSEALEGLRKNKQDDHLPHRKSVEVELADTLIRIFDYAGAKGLDLGGALAEKMEYNNNRADHKATARALADGKKF